MKKNKTQLKSKKNLVLKVSKRFFKTKNNPKFTKTAKLVMKIIDNHFKNDGWDLRSDYLVEEVFYLAYGEYLSDYLYKELFSNPKKGYYLTLNDKHGIVIRKKGQKK